ncbi:hypothetical protein RND71_043730 [Anisodus tanguticus]|uniref:Nucleolar protein 56 n=1 Tax=Anisodus tanguticus TaxID=243964 RepID=A0AAE1UU38_9SOLA|nr:hypothetical protein RND71_043730 [Anisodus tanguticus]
MPNKLNKEQINNIIELHLNRKNNLEISRILNVTRKSVTKYVQIYKKKREPDEESKRRKKLSVQEVHDDLTLLLEKLLLNVMEKFFMKTEKSIETYEKALRMNPKDANLMRKVGQLYIKIHLYEKVLLKLAEIELNNNNYEEVQNYCRIILQNNPNEDNALLHFSSNDSNPSLDEDNRLLSTAQYFRPRSRSLSSPVRSPAVDCKNNLNLSTSKENLNYSNSQSSPIKLGTLTFRRRSRSLSSPIRSPGIENRFVQMSYVYKERFPNAIKQMNEKLEKFINDNPELIPEIASDAVTRFVHHQAIEMAKDCLQKSKDELLTSNYFYEMTEGLEKLLTESKEKSSSAVQHLKKLIKQLMLIVSRPARLLECLEFNPEEFYRFLEAAEGQAKTIQGIKKDLPQYIINKLGLTKDPLTEFNQLNEHLFENQFNDKQVYGTPEYIAPEVILRQGYGKPVDWWSMGIILYEFLIGCVPFFGETAEELFSHVINDEIEWPSNEDWPLPEEAKILITQFLMPNPIDRLGTSGAAEVKDHPFFDGINWDALLRQKAEFVPQLIDEDDTSYFDTRLDRYNHDLEDSEGFNDSDDSPLFSSFSSCSPRYHKVYSKLEKSIEKEKILSSIDDSKSNQIFVNESSSSSKSSTNKHINESNYDESSKEATDSSCSKKDKLHEAFDKQLAIKDILKFVTDSNQTESSDKLIDSIKESKEENYLKTEENNQSENEKRPLTPSIKETPPDDSNNEEKDNSGEENKSYDENKLSLLTKIRPVTKSASASGLSQIIFEPKTQRRFTLLDNRHLEHEENCLASNSNKSSLTVQDQTDLFRNALNKNKLSKNLLESSPSKQFSRHSGYLRKSSLRQIGSPYCSSASSRDNSPSHDLINKRKSFNKLQNSDKLSADINLNSSLNNFCKLKPPVILRKSNRGFGFSFKAIRVYYGDSDIYTVHHLVMNVEPNSPAFEAGLKTGDLITHINSEPLQGLLHHQVLQLVLSGSDTIQIRTTPLETTSIKSGGRKRNPNAIRLAKRGTGGTLIILFEHASGYSLFRVKEFEEISALKSSVQKSVSTFSKFQSIVQLVSYCPFKSAQSALDNMNALSDGGLTEELSVFLENNLPKGKKKQSFQLGVADPKLGSSIQEQLGVACIHTDAVPEIIRGIRAHASKLIEQLSENHILNAEVSLSRNFSRGKVKFNVKRVDNMIIQAIALLDQLEKDLNVYSMRLKEWYSYHFPELSKLAKDNYVFAQVAKIIGNRKEIDDEGETLSQLENVLDDPKVAQNIISSSKTSMGMEISSIDLINISSFANKVINLTEYKNQLMEYMVKKMNTIAPNLSALIGETLGARLISKAGSLVNLAKCPASTIQVLGAEKSLFRALKKRVGTPKYGLIFHSTFIGKADQTIKGKVSRLLANKCGVASRIDYFLENQTSVFGEKLKTQIEEKLEFFKKGTYPKSNLDSMKEVIEDYQQQVSDAKKRKKEKKKAKKDKKMKTEEESMVEV